jgi:hypothetical protein
LGQIGVDAVGEGGELGDGRGEVQLGERAFEPARVLRRVVELLGLAPAFGLPALPVGLSGFLRNLPVKLLGESAAACGCGLRSARRPRPTHSGHKKRV